MSLILEIADSIQQILLKNSDLFAAICRFYLDFSAA